MLEGKDGWIKLQQPILLSIVGVKTDYIEQESPGKMVIARASTERCEIICSMEKSFMASKKHKL